MPKEITRQEVEALLQQGARLVEVLPSEEYTDEHLVGAINIPLRELDVEAPKRLDRTKAVIVYCFDSA